MACDYYFLFIFTFYEFMDKGANAAFLNCFCSSSPSSVRRIIFITCGNGLSDFGNVVYSYIYLRFYEFGKCFCVKSIFRGRF